jgi:hypothetical protein
MIPPVEHIRREAQGPSQLHRIGTHQPPLHQRRIGEPTGAPRVATGGTTAGSPVSASDALVARHASTSTAWLPEGAALGARNAADSAGTRASWSQPAPPRRCCRPCARPAGGPTLPSTRATREAEAVGACVHVPSGHRRRATQVPRPRPAPVRLQVLPRHRAVRHVPRIARVNPGAVQRAALAPAARPTARLTAAPPR